METMRLFTLAPTSACCPAPRLAPAHTRKLIRTCACAWTRTTTCTWSAPVYLHASVYIWAQCVCLRFRSHGPWPNGPWAHWAHGQMRTTLVVTLVPTSVVIEHPHSKSYHKVICLAWVVFVFLIFAGCHQKRKHSRGRKGWRCCFLHIAPRVPERWWIIAQTDQDSDL